MRNYGMKRALLGAAIAALAMNAPAAQAATATGTATAKILRQITLTKTSDLQYATIISGATASTIAVRSEEHTSELQSLMRISYAVFCLKKKKTTTQNIYIKKNPNKIDENT